MTSEQELKTHLQEISPDALFTQVNYESPEKFQVTIKCRADEDGSIEVYNEFTKGWLEKFSKFTLTAWIVQRSYPNLKRMLYRKLFTCHHSGQNKAGSIEKKKNKECRALIDFKIKKINRNTIKNDKTLRKGLNMQIIIYFVHTHKVRAAASYSSLKCLPETDELFYKYMSSGYTASMAKKYHELTILSKYGPGGEERLMNANENPSLSHIAYLYQKKRNIITELSLEKAMEGKKSVCEERGAALRYLPDSYTTVVATPFMKNVLGSYDLDNVIIDSCIIKNDLVATFFFMPSELGALPIACALHTSQSESSFNQALFSLKLLIEEITCKSFEPQLLLINNIQELITTCDAIFPSKKTILSRVSICADIWSLICQHNNRVDIKYKVTTMHQFYSLLHSDNSEQAEKMYTELLNNTIVKTIFKLKIYFDNIWVKRKDYILQTNNIIVDISIRILREFLLVMCKSFNIPATFDLLLNILDNYWSRILHCHLERQSIVETYTMFLPKSKEVLEMCPRVKRVDDNVFCLEGRDGKMSNTTFTTDTWVCNCGVGAGGRFCEHLCAALRTVDINEITIDILEDKRAFYLELAGERSAEEIASTICPRNVPIKTEIYDEFTTNEDNTLEINQVLTYGMQTEENHYGHGSYYYDVEKRDRNDPLDGEKDNDTVQVSTTVKRDNKTTYETALKSLNDEFRRLNRLFRSNPNAYNLDTMGRLARELAKIRPLEKVNISNMYVKENDDDVHINMGD